MPEQTQDTRTSESDNRLSFDEAVVLVKQRKQAAFAAMPVFGDEDAAAAEGARIFLLLPDEAEGWILHFIAGPFFSAGYAANDVIPADEIPDRVRELMFMPTRCEEDWLTDQLQILLAKLTQAAGIDSQLPDYTSLPVTCATPETVFPVHFLNPEKH